MLSLSEQTFIIYSKMGNQMKFCIDCNKTLDESGHEGMIIDLTTYNQSEWPKGDRIINQWLKQNNDDILSKMKPLKNSSYSYQRNQRYYVGDKQMQRPNGRCLIYEPGLILFHGSFQNGIPSGMCKVNFLNRHSEYQGKVVQGKAEGFGTYKDGIKKITFKGEWHKSLPQKGQLNFSNDKNIELIEIQNYMKGLATIYYTDSKKYKGQINNVKMAPNGRGCVTFPFGSDKFRFEGEWIQGQIYGNGKFQWRDKSVYEGFYWNGIKQGYGKFKYPSGRQFIGYWKQGKQEGSGILFTQTGKILQRGEWNQGQFIKQLNQRDYQNLQKINKTQFAKLKQKMPKYQKQQKNTKQPDQQQISHKKRKSSTTTQSIKF